MRPRYDLECATFVSANTAPSKGGSWIVLDEDRRTQDKDRRMLDEDRRTLDEVTVLEVGSPPIY